MSISHLFNLAKTLLREKNCSWKANELRHSDTPYRVCVQESPEQSGQPMLQAGRQTGHDGALSCPHGQMQSSAAKAPASPLWRCAKVGMHQNPCSAPQPTYGAHKSLSGVKDARWGKEKGSGPCRQAAQGLKPSIWFCSEKQCVIVGILPFSGGKSSHQSGYVLVKIPENETTIYGTKVL